MSRPRLALGAIAVLAACGFAAGPAQAGDGTLVPLSEIFSAYQAICYAHAGDPKAQVAVATAAPYGFKLDGTDDDGTARYESARLSVRILDGSDRKYCLVMGNVSADTKPADGAREAKAVLGDPATSEDNTVLWMDTVSTKNVIHMFMAGTTGDGKTVAAYATGSE